MNCLHSDSVLVVLSGEQWSAVCKLCARRWTHQSEDVPRVVWDAVEASRRMVQ